MSMTVGSYEAIRSIGDDGDELWLGRRVDRAGRVRGPDLVTLRLLGDEDAKVKGRVDQVLRGGYVERALNHVNIATIFGVERANNKNYLIEEYVDGPDLEQIGKLVMAGGPILTDAQVGQIMAKSLRALAHAHRRGICHRGLSRRQVVVSVDGVVKLVGFGGAGSTRETLGRRWEVAVSKDLNTMGRSLSGLLHLMGPGADGRTGRPYELCRGLTGQDPKLRFESPHKALQYLDGWSSLRNARVELKELVDALAGPKPAPVAEEVRAGGSRGEGLAVGSSLSAGPTLIEEPSAERVTVTEAMGEPTRVEEPKQTQTPKRAEVRKRVDDSRKVGVTGKTKPLPMVKDPPELAEPGQPRVRQKRPSPSPASPECEDSDDTVVGPSRVRQADNLRSELEGREEQEGRRAAASPSWWSWAAAGVTVGISLSLAFVAGLVIYVVSPQGAGVRGWLAVLVADDGDESEPKQPASSGGQTSVVDEVPVIIAKADDLVVPGAQSGVASVGGTEDTASGQTEAKGGEPALPERKGKRKRRGNSEGEGDETASDPVVALEESDDEYPGEMEESEAQGPSETEESEAHDSSETEKPEEDKPHNPDEPEEEVFYVSVKFAGKKLGDRINRVDVIVNRRCKASTSPCQLVRGTHSVAIMKYSGKRVDAGVIEITHSDCTVRVEKTGRDQWSLTPVCR